MRRRGFFSGLTAALALLVSGQAVAWATPQTVTAPLPRPSCANERLLCKEVLSPEEVFGKDHYVGHDEPSVNFYSTRPGSGNDMVYNMVLPQDPPHSPAAGHSYNFQLHPAFWFGMAMCDTQSYPLQVSTCAPDSDTNIKPLGSHPGASYLEVQFFPPGWALWPAGVSCDPSKWCAAIANWSVSENPFTGQVLNDSCARGVGVEYGNFAFITVNGVPPGPPNPVNASNATFTPNASTLLMAAGDTVVTHLHDTAHGLRVDITDKTSGATGLMVMSAANGFGQVQFAPNPSRECHNIPYDFHPMYSTSTTDSRTPWAAASGNVEFTDETGHFDLCSAVDPNSGSCSGKESQNEAADGDDNFCFTPPPAPYVSVQGCIDTNTGFDGLAYQAGQWPDGTAAHPQPVHFTSPITGGANYSAAGFETDLPALETSDSSSGHCNLTNGSNCTLMPTTDEGVQAGFYPFYSITAPKAGGCTWMLGADIAGQTANDFGKNSQYGSILFQQFLVRGGNGATEYLTKTFRQILSTNPCPNPLGTAGPSQG